MENLLIKILFGHLIGDFFFQTQTMADTKYRSGWIGVYWCSIHVLVYTFIVAISVSNFSLIFLLGVFVPHWIIDRYSLAHKWMILIGRGDLIKSNDSKSSSFGTIIYVVIDQTIHFGCLYALTKILN